MNRLKLLSLSIEPSLRRFSIVAAYATTGVLYWLTQLPAEVVDEKSARAWLVFMALPPWLLICVIAIRSGYRLGGAWKWLAWPPLAVPTLWFIASGLMQVDWRRLAASLTACVAFHVSAAARDSSVMVIHTD